MVLSPVEESVEGREKQRRREKQSQAEQLSSRWDLMRTCRDYLEKNSSRWEKRTREETERIKAEEKKERLEMGKKKKNKFGSKNEELTKNEKDDLKKLTEIRLEIAEIRQHLWRKYRDSGQEILATVRQRRERL